MKKFRNLILAAISILSCGSLLAQTKIIPMQVNHNVLEFVGQFNNTATTSQQYGYISTILGVDGIFADGPQNETTALFTFVTNANTDRVIVNGPFKIVNRSGTTTIYLNTPPSDFTNPASFSQGTPIQVSEYTQQVVLNSSTNTFTTLHTNTITQVITFSLNGSNYRLGRVGQGFRTTYSGVVDSSTNHTGWFGGNAIGVRH